MKWSNASAGVQRGGRLLPGWGMGLAVAACLAASAGCSKPSEEKARGWYAKHESTLDQIDGKTREAVRAIPELTGAGFACSPARPAVSTSASGSASIAPTSRLAAPIQKLVEESRCTNEALKFNEARRAKMREVDAHLLPELLALPGVIGVELRVRSAQDEAWQPLGQLGLTPGGVSHGRVPWTSGVDVNGRKLGWGEYQTSYENHRGKFGDGVARPGFEVGWELREGALTVQVQAYVLAEHQVDDVWRSGLR